MIGKELGVDKHQILLVKTFFESFFIVVVVFFGCIQQAGDMHGLRDGQTSDIYC